MDSQFIRGVIKFQLESTTDAKVERLLQMPPVVKRREDVSSVITEDKDIDMHTTEKLNFVFTDITHGLPKRVSSVFTLLNLYICTRGRPVHRNETELLQRGQDHRSVTTF